MDESPAIVNSCASPQAIQSHYDLGNEFYKLWLDPTMTYSCALWDEQEDIGVAQINKIDWHLKRVGVPAGGSLLEIGSGWGALLERAVTQYGIKRATGLTLSHQQAAWVQERQLPGVDLRLEGWLGHKPAMRYDGIVSVEAFEAFARADQPLAQKLQGYRRFFQLCHQWLRPLGKLTLQTIFSERPTRDADCFLGNEIFPEADLPHLDEIITSAQGLFEIELLRNDRADYARTLRCWLNNLRANKSQAINLVGMDNYNKYEKYLGVCVVGFSTGALNLARIALCRTSPTWGVA